LDAEIKGKAFGGALEGELRGEVLSAEGSFVPFAISISPEGVKAEAEVGAEANLVKATGNFKVNLTLKKILDNTVGIVVQDWHAPDSWNHGIVIGAKGEAGIGAAAKASAGIGANKEGIYIKAEAKLGLGPMAGLNVIFGFK